MTTTGEIATYIEEASSFNCQSAEELEIFRLRFLGKNGILRSLFEELKTLTTGEKKELGKKINELKNTVEANLSALKAKIESAPGHDYKAIDITLPGDPIDIGSRHPISIVMDQMIELFQGIGFVVSEGREIETEWYNFTALNIPEDHPARDMQDTFYIKNPEYLLRTHTSPQQIRIMEKKKPPIRVICPGRVYRNETISARSHCLFHQIEGLHVDEGVSFADMKNTLYYFVQKFFGDKTKVRFRASYFPFTEPSAEMDISCLLCEGKGCAVCKQSGWVEVLGCGMVDPAVFENCGIDSKKYSGYAFGIGVERPAMLKFGINDIRLFFENDIRFLKQFRSL